MRNIKEIDGVKIHKKHKAFCHCGSVEMDLDLPNGISGIRRCVCFLKKARSAHLTTESCAFDRP